VVPEPVKIECLWGLGENVWGRSVYDEAGESSHYGFRGKWSHDHDFGEPKDRFAGFKGRRGGNGSRKRRIARRQERSGK